MELASYQDRILLSCIQNLLGTSVGGYGPARSTPVTTLVVGQAVFSPCPSGLYTDRQNEEIHQDDDVTG